ncbi:MULTISPECIES: TetR/AcrR family transcriptional regulator [Streptomyces]|uniref:TetR/AcrR family transcriptional regulator n=1 Tax=Streptomyces TaxID=1883 RepID=UPI0016481475|nr:MULTISPECIES: TetR/AcrR family transcriptional regulator [Streptomyces]MBT3082252.1 TetR family transcriptional regulator [Streptomyces sp. COG20]MBT3091131.1 TetR family transcriptional regulator [Streptomyces sp. CYG21]MBT3097021.1 TetR family transcriptional regulator [Streptomyces sp. CBG30]MBT3104219.1 TetR family transcriptional regulator [Streptomyces sp. COG19]MBT3110527.1 TetR family transcriptional regulator [Streptomyces sp. CYG20]
MARNPERRVALTDAAIEVLAQEGARGLTFRAVDTRAGVPVGTASNYFSSRDDLFMQTGARIHSRMTPDPAQVAQAMLPAPSRALVTELMHWLVRRMTDDRTGYLALLELRLEATRRPALRAQLTATVRTAFEESAAFHRDWNLPGDHTAFLVLYLAMTGVLLEHFTLPDMLGDTALETLVDAVVERIIPGD